MAQRLVASALLSIVAAAVLSAQPAQEAPFRSAVELVRLDFFAFSQDGKLVADLKAADLTLKVDGRPREIRSFQFVRLDEPVATPRAVVPDKLLPPPFGTNTLDEAGRTVVLIFETDSIRANVIQQATTASTEFVNGLSPRDRVGLVTMPYGGIIVEPTRDHSQVLKALPTISGQASQQTTESAKSCRTRDTLNALADHLTGLAYLEGPKTIVFISSGMLLPRRDAPLTSAPGPCEIKTSDYDQVGRATAAARGQFYVIKPDDLVIDSIRRGLVVERGVLRPEPLDPSLSRFKSSDDEQAGLESLAGVTQGTLLRLTPADRTAFARIMRESAGYYLVGFEPRESERNGSYRRVEFDVARAGVKVRSRPNVLIDKGEGKRLALTPHAMLRDGKSYRDLPLRAVALGSPNPGDTKMTIVALVESLDSTATLESAAFGLIDQRGRLVAQWTATARELASRPLMSAGLVAPGRYRLRAAAIDATGRRGAADYEFSAAAVSASGMTMSAMVLGVGFPRSFVPKLQFYGEPTAAGQFEIFGAPETGTLSVAMELATTEDGPALIRVPGVVVATRDADRRRAIGVIPVGTFGAGDYVMRGVVSLDGRPIGHVSRVLRKAAG